MAMQLSVALEQMPASNIALTDELLHQFQLPTRLNEPLKSSDLMAAMQRDKKNRRGSLRFVTMKALGSAVTTDCIDVALIEQLWRKAGAE
jgi:3-dehydroquinate synthetase